MKHLGDITKISGYTAPVVDVVIGGSPCQDLSVAGKRAGLDGERSGLFMEQIRIVKEMRELDRRDGRADIDVRPRYMVWENVPGAFSSNKGEDFRVVLEEIAKIADPTVSIPRPDKGKWEPAGCIVGKGHSIAWRICNAQYFGVPQRRRRISLIADFNGHSAPYILFEEREHDGDAEPSDRESYLGEIGNRGRQEVRAITGSVYGNLQPREPQGQGDAETVRGCAELYDSERRTISFQERAGCAGEPAVTHQHPIVLESNQVHATIDESGKCPTLTASMGMGGGYVPMIVEKHPVEPAVAYDARGNGDGQTAATITGDHENRATDYSTLICFRKTGHPVEAGGAQGWKETEVNDTLNVFDNSEKRTPTLVVSLDRASYNQGKNAQYDMGIDESGTAHTVIAKDPGAVAYAAGFCPEVSANTRGIGYEVERSPTLRAGVTPGVAIVDSYGGHSESYKIQDHTDTLKQSHYKMPPCISYAYPEVDEGVVGTLDAHYANMPGERGGIERTMVYGTDCRNGKLNEDIIGTLQSKESGGVSTNYNNVVTCATDNVRYIVRRLTPRECERLQSYPDDFTLLDVIDDMSEDDVEFWNGYLLDKGIRELTIRMNEEGIYEKWKIVTRDEFNVETCEIEEVCEWVNTHKKYVPKTKTQLIKWYNRSFVQSSDSARYKALGNSIALCAHRWYLERISALYDDHTPTMASLFDGIGGFPYLWEQINGKGTCLWASEIEEFPIAVTNIILIRRKILSKSGIDYFPLDVVLEDNIKLVEAEFGITGFGVIVKLYQKIYGGFGYYVEFTKEVVLLFAREIGLGGNTVSEIVRASIKRGIFDSKLFEKYHILTSRGIQKRYFEAVSRRKNVIVKSEYLLVDHALIPKNVCIFEENVDIYKENEDNSKQSKVKESKVITITDTYTENAPTLKEISDYCRARKLNVNPSRFFNYYNNRGWRTKDGQVINDWYTLCEMWSNTDDKRRPQISNDQTGSFDTDEFFEAALSRTYEQ